MSELNSLTPTLLPTAVRPAEQDQAYRQAQREKPQPSRETSQGEYLPAKEDYSDMEGRSEQRHSVKDIPRPLAMYMETGEGDTESSRGQYLNLFA